ncbi:MAG: hypothetical protein R3F39_23530 [Myxococcota bacterium]
MGAFERKVAAWGSGSRVAGAMVIAAAMVWPVGPVAARCPREVPRFAPARAGGFDCATAAASLGAAGAEVAFCQELLRDLWRVVLMDPQREGVLTTHRFVSEGGGVSKARGLGALEAYLRRTRVADAPWLDRLAFAELLEATGALPEGFTADALTSGVDPETRVPASVRTRPLTVSIVQSRADGTTQRAVLTLSTAGKPRWNLIGKLERGSR